MIDVRPARPLPRLQTLRPLPRLQTLRPVYPPRLDLPRLPLPRLRMPRRAVLVVWTCGPLFAAQLLLLTMMLTQ